MTAQPKRFLFATWEGGGTVLPMIAAAKKLAARGHDVRIMSESCNREEIEAAGIRFSSWRRAPNRPDRSAETDFLRDWEVSPGPERIRLVIERIMTGPSLAYARDVVDELKRDPADLVISSEFLLGVLSGCESLGQAVTVLTAGICPYPFPQSPPFGGGMAPPTNAEEKLALAQLKSGVRQMLDSGLTELNATRQALGLKPIEHVLDQLRSAGAAVLLGTSQAFDFAWDEMPHDVRYVGPQITDPATTSWSSPWPIEDTRPLILVAFSTTYQEHEAIVQRVIDAGAELPIRLLVTTGDALSPDALRPGDNCAILRKAPHVKVMNEAAAVVTHGGHGTVIRAAAAGLPMLLIPHGRDQDDNAARIVLRGAGLSLTTDASTSEIGAALGRLLREPAFQQASSELGSRITSEIRQSSIVEDLESLARTSAVHENYVTFETPIGCVH